jgi:hypothetical protein
VLAAAVPLVLHARIDGHLFFVRDGAGVDQELSNVAVELIAPTVDVAAESVFEVNAFGQGEAFGTVLIYRAVLPERCLRGPVRALSTQPWAADLVVRPDVAEKSDFALDDLVA